MACWPISERGGMRPVCSVHEIWNQHVHYGRFASLSSELRSCVKVEVAVPPNSPYGLCGRKTRLNLNTLFFNPPVPATRKFIS